MPPSTETIEELRTLYIQREMYNRALDGVLTKIQTILHNEPDYKAWYDGDGILTALPDWIHQITGGRPYLTPQKPVVQRQRKEKDEKTQVSEKMFSKLMEGFK